MPSLQFAQLVAASFSLWFVSVAGKEDAGKLEGALAEPVTMSFEQISLEESLNVLVKKGVRQTRRLRH